MTDQKNSTENQEPVMTQEATSSQQAQDTTYTPEDIEKSKTMAGLSYLIFFLPLIVCPDSKYGRFHANQALLLFIVGLGGNIILSIIPIIGWVLIPIFNIAVLILGIMGLINGFGGKAKRLPIFGKFDILK